jgi:hypothetical protein
MAARPGFTLTEVLIAGALGVFVTGLALQQVTEYFRLQQTLLARTQLRQDLQNARERLASRMRCGVNGYPISARQVSERFPRTLPPASKDAPGGFICWLPLDQNHDGMLSAGDQYELVFWYVAGDPLHPKRSALFEMSAIVPAFGRPTEPDRQLELFDLAAGRGRMLAANVTRLEIENADPANHMVRIKLRGAMPVPGQARTTELALSELVAQRSLCEAGELPSFEEVLQQLKESP